MRNTNKENALTGRFFMPAGLLLSMALITPTVASAEKCASTHFDEKSIIEKVIDGDTVILEDGRHVRLVGIDTPEIFHDGRAPEQGAVRAKQRLQALAGEGTTVGLRYDKEKRDRHGRTLAHIFRPNGQNIQAGLLKEGLAMPLTIPPNLFYIDCYASAARQARSSKIGLWGLAKYVARDVSQLTGGERGYYIIQGRVQRVGESRSAVWLNLENNVALRIVREDLNYFNQAQLQQYAGQRLEARGWLYKRNDQLRMRIRHSNDLSIIAGKSLN